MDRARVVHNGAVHDPRLRFALAALLALGLPGCVLIDAPMLALHSLAGGLHNARQASGIRPFFLPDGRLGMAANGALAVEREPGGEFVTLADSWSEIDDPEPNADGSAVVFTSGRELIQAGGAHKDHVFQLYSLELASGAWRRLTHSRRAEAWPRVTADGRALVFVRRAEYDGWSLDDPWGAGSLFMVDADGSNERRLTEGLFQPYFGLALVADDTRLVFAARAPEEAGRRALYALDLPPTGPPRAWLADAYLPTPIPGTAELLVARVHADGHGLARLDPAGAVLEESPLRVREFLGLAVSPDARRIVFSDFDPEGGLFGEYRLWSLPMGGSEPALLATRPYRPAKRFKPLDVLAPPSWWFHPGRSPGSR